MKYASIAAALTSLTLLAACAPVGHVTLLPEEGGKAGAVEIKTKAGSAILSQPYQTATVGQNSKVSTGETNAAAVAARYKLMLTLQPAPALHFTLRFTDGSRLTPESEAQLEQILVRTAERPGAEIFVTGHTDTVGRTEANDTLSLQRAHLIRERLIGSGFKPELVEAIGRGERELAVPTADDVEEPRNRRAEIVVR